MGLGCGLKSRTTGSLRSPTSAAVASRHKTVEPTLPLDTEFAAPRENSSSCPTALPNRNRACRPLFVQQREVPNASPRREGRCELSLPFSSPQARRNRQAASCCHAVACATFVNPLWLPSLPSRHNCRGPGDLLRTPPRLFLQREKRWAIYLPVSRGQVAAGHSALSPLIP